MKSLSERVMDIARASARTRDGESTRSRMDDARALRVVALAASAARAIGFASEAHCSFLRSTFPDERDKVYVIERHAVAGAFATRALALRFAKCAAMAFQPRAQDWFTKMDQALELERVTGERQPLPSFTGGVREVQVACAAFARETAVHATRRACEKVILAASSDRLGAKLCKNVPASAKRKANRVTWERGLAKIEQSANMFRTTTLAHAINALGEWLVDVASAAYGCARMYFINRQRDDDAARKALQSFKRAVMRAVVKQACIILGGSSAVATFALCRPRGSSQRVVSWGTLFFVTAGEIAGSIFYVKVADYFLPPPPLDDAESRAAARLAAADADVLLADADEASESDSEESPIPHRSNRVRNRTHVSG